MNMRTEPSSLVRGEMPFPLVAVFEKLKMAEEEVSGLSFVLLVGSYAEGLASPTSDVDLVFVGERATSIAERGQFATCLIDERRVEVWNLDLAEFECNVSIADRPAYRGQPIRQLELTHKLVNAACLSGQSTYEALVAARRNAFSARMSDYFSQSAEGVFKDVLGALQSQDFATAAGQARELMGSAVDAYLASRGDTYPKRKWRARRLLRLQGEIPALAAEYVAIEFGGPSKFEDVAVRDWIKRCLALVRRFQIRQYFSQEDEAHEPSVSDLFYLYRLGDSFVVRTQSKVLQLPASEALSVLHGRQERLANVLRLARA